MKSEWARIRGLASLIGEAVDHGSRAVEKVHRETVRRPFAILELVKPIESPVRIIEAVHSASLTGVYTSIRLVNRIVGGATTIAVDLLEARDLGRSPDIERSESVGEEPLAARETATEEETAESTSTDPSKA